MFNLQGSEIVIVLLLALVVLGPEKLPDAMRKMGQAYAELKKMSSGFQNEFRSVMDEPMREIRDTANLLRDSADFTKLQDGDREEKPKSAEMAAVDPNDVPIDDIPTFESPTEDAAGPELAADSQPAPFADERPAAERPTPTAVPAPPLPFTGMSAAAPATQGADDGATGDDGVIRNVPGDVTESVAGDGAAGDDAAGDDAATDIDDESDVGR